MFFLCPLEFVLHSSTRVAEGCGGVHKLHVVQAKLIRGDMHNNFSLWFATEKPLPVLILSHSNP